MPDFRFRNLYGGYGRTTRVGVNQCAALSSLEPYGSVVSVQTTQFQFQLREKKLGSVPVPVPRGKAWVSSSSSQFRDPDFQFQSVRRPRLSVPSVLSNGIQFQFQFCRTQRADIRSSSSSNSLLSSSSNTRNWNWNWISTEFGTGTETTLPYGWVERRRVDWLPPLETVAKYCSCRRAKNLYFRI